MVETNKRLKTAAESYFTGLKEVRISGGGTAEPSNYIPLVNLLNAIGSTLKPRVVCIAHIRNLGAGYPDLGLFTARQMQGGRPHKGQVPERGVIEVKSAYEDAWLTASGDQVSRYWGLYRLVLVTNLRDFVLLGKDAAGRPAKLETFRLAESAEDFWRSLERPRIFAHEKGVGLGEYLARALSHRTVLTEPKDLARLLASYARDGLACVETVGDAPQLAAVRSALEEALGVRFEGESGARFFRSTLVQTLFYGVFSAWVLWARRGLTAADPFRWREAAWHLRAPVLRALFQQLSDPGRLPKRLVEVLDWAGAALERVDRAAFLSRFGEGEAVPYFYEPFLEAFDPALKKQLGVWYTPAEVVRYMVARVDQTLKNDLGIAGGLADENVYVLDPCCGTGAYLAEVLRRIAANLVGDKLAGAQLREAAMKRVFGFEIMPAPFVVSHMQVGLTLQELDAPFDDDDTGQRARIFLTNALTGWEPRATKRLPFPEFEEERDRADQVKQHEPILVILGNPPYNGFAGMAMDEERELSEAYRTTRRAHHPRGQGLNDLYVRFFRMAERRIAEETGRGVVCFISNYSWLDGLSFTGMRERYLEAFDTVRIDCLNGDKYKTGKVAPDGSPDPSIFSTESNPVGIQVGTAITTLVRKAEHEAAGTVGFRHLWGQAKRAELVETAEEAPEALYEKIKPVLSLGLPFMRATVSAGWFDWPSLPDLFPVSFPGVKTSRNGFLIDTDIDRLRERIENYFDANLSHEEIARRYPAAMTDAARFEARRVRDMLLKRGGPDEAGFLRHAYRPFDIRWLYWEKDTKLLDEKRASYRPHVFEGNVWIEARKREAKEDFSRGTLVRCMADNFGNGLSSYFPAYLRGDVMDNNATCGRHANLSATAQRYLQRLGLGVEDLFHHVLATLHDPVWRKANAGALRMEWPRIPLPGWPDGEAAGAAEKLAWSAARGRELAALLDPETPVPGVTQQPLRPELAVIAVPATVSGGNMAGDDFAVTAGWGHHGQGAAVMPGPGHAVERAFTPDERDAMGDTLHALGNPQAKRPRAGLATFDIHLNGEAYWRNIPAAVWVYHLGGYQALKKWLSYREHTVLGRPLLPEEVQHFSDTARRIAAILLLAGARFGHSGLGAS